MLNMKIYILIYTLTKFNGYNDNSTSHFSKRYLSPFKWAMLIVLMLFLPGCLVLKSSPAPQCISYIAPPIIGGCSGKSAIIDLYVSQHPACLQIEVNNCNGGVLEINNQCSAPFHLDSAIVPAGELKAWDLMKINGEHSLINANGNFSYFIPDNNEQINLTGWLDNEKIQVNFVKTKNYAIEVAESLE